ncbi:hypothetical protein I2483_03250 [Sporosarcina sp. E16_3]|uniref:hypothetical protein n=1 Tax=Sporosarcina sp. E16_3 TaxID=2789293 RepID=UPI001A9316C4|nr:hypothetical protein [Sporosarcina sp. E16_3]MBO0600669.1 hypothetical protein [Sporosarcina sp. E16_3]
MKLSEKNVLIATAILFVIVAALLNLGNKEIAENFVNLPSTEIASSTYKVNDGKLALEFGKSTNELLFLSNIVIR